MKRRREARKNRCDFRLRTRRFGVRLKITAVNPVLVVIVASPHRSYIAFSVATNATAAIAVATVATCSHLPPLSLIAISTTLLQQRIWACYILH